MALPQAKADLAGDLLSRHSVAPAGGGWAAEARAQAAARLRQMGGPVRRDEYWKYTDPRALAQTNPPRAAVADAEEPVLFDDLDRLRIVFVDGVFDATQSDQLALEAVSVEPLAEAMQSDIHWAREVYGLLETRGQDPVPRPLAALNTAVAGQGMAIRVSGAAPKPIAFEYRQGSDGSDAVIHHVVKVEPGATVTVIETGTAGARLNTCMEMEIGTGAAFHHVRAQGRDHDRHAATHLFTRLAAEALFKSFTLTVNGVLTRNEVVIEIAGENAAAHVGGAAAGDGTFHHDDTVFMTHDAVDCESRQVFKKVLRNGATGAFQGKILVKEGAQKTDGYQISQGLLLDDDSQFLAKPELEIYADDVACSHGSTVGAVDEEALFYLTSRGVPRVEAQDMLVLAFLDEAIQEIDDDAIADAIRARLASWLSRRRG
ncbi:MAG: SufD family Fe-S cluster assembly protein [Pseudomonadota bacterium]